MATTNKSSKAKTKTSASKTKVTKTTKARATAKASSKSLSTKVAKPAPKRTPADVLTKLNALSAFISLGLAVAAGLLMNNTAYQVVAGHLAKNELASKTGEVLVPASSHLYDIELRWLVVATLLLASILPILNITAYKARYSAAVKSRVNTLRWIDMAIISALMVKTVALLTGINDVLTLKLIVGLILITCVLDWIAEKRNVQAGRPVWSESIVSIVTGSLPWIVIGGFAIGTIVSGRVSSPWYVYTLYVALLLGFSLYCLNQINAIRRFKTAANYKVVERNYLVIGILVKIAFASILIVGFQK